MSSFLPVPQLQCQEIDVIRNTFSEASQPLNWPSLGDSTIGEFSTPFWPVWPSVVYFLMGWGTQQTQVYKEKYHFTKKSNI